MAVEWDGQPVLGLDDVPAGQLDAENSKGGELSRLLGAICGDRQIDVARVAREGQIGEVGAFDAPGRKSLAQVLDTVEIPERRDLQAVESQLEQPARRAHEVGPMSGRSRCSGR